MPPGTGRLKGHAIRHQQANTPQHTCRASLLSRVSCAYPRAGRISRTQPPRCPTLSHRSRHQEPHHLALLGRTPRLFLPSALVGITEPDGSLLRTHGRQHRGALHRSALRGPSLEDFRLHALQLEALAKKSLRLHQPHRDPLRPTHRPSGCEWLDRFASGRDGCPWPSGQRHYTSFYLLGSTAVPAWDSASLAC